MVAGETIKLPFKNEIATPAYKHRAKIKFVKEYIRESRCQNLYTGNLSNRNK